MAICINISPPRLHLLVLDSYLCNTHNRISSIDSGMKEQMRFYWEALLLTATSVDKPKHCAQERLATSCSIFFPQVIFSGIWGVRQSTRICCTDFRIPHWATQLVFSTYRPSDSHCFSGKVLFFSFFFSFFLFPCRPKIANFGSRAAALLQNH